MVGLRRGVRRGELMVDPAVGVHRAPSGMRRFTMRRAADVSGVSGTGNVLEGVLFSTGIVVIHWLTPPPRGSISVVDSVDEFLSIHVLPHPENGTVMTYE